jgi:hypothetical protein
VNMEQCNEGVTGVATGCFWLFGNNNEQSNDGVCRAKNDMQLACSDVKRSSQCQLSGVDKLDTECVWVVTEAVGQECQQVKSSCEDITQGPATCNYAGAAKSGTDTLSCLWVGGAATSCQEVKSSCDSLITQPVCETPGAAVVDGGGTPLKCVWTASSGQDGECKEEVCYMYKMIE